MASYHFAPNESDAVCMAEVNERKASKLYAFIDGSDFWSLLEKCEARLAKWETVSEVFASIVL